MKSYDTPDFTLVDTFIGVDEAGRGCLAGPVVAGAVLFAPDFNFQRDLPGLNDSKKLGEKQRKHLAGLVPKLCLGYGIGFAWQDEIDSVNILNATFRAMSRAVLTLARRLELASPPQNPPRSLPLLLPALRIDGNKCIPDSAWAFCVNAPPVSVRAWEQYLSEPLNLLPSCIPPLPEQEALVGGDALVPAISAASVMAKTIRDSLMENLDAPFPQYGFRKHKGYGTKEHLEALAMHGPCPLHRLTFQGVRPKDDKTFYQIQGRLLG